MAAFSNINPYLYYCPMGNDAQWASCYGIVALRSTIWPSVEKAGKRLFK
jgi:hypothetical protein